MRRLLLLAALLASPALAATGQRAGVAVEADVSNRKVTSTGGTTARSLAARFADVVNVKDFLPAGQPDGTTDNTAGIQAAVNAAHTGAAFTLGGARVVFPPGEYKTTAPIALYDNVRLVGAGRNATRIKKTTNTVGGATAIKAPGRATPTYDTNYAVDSIVSVVHGADEHAYHWGISGIALLGAAGSPNTYGVFAPRAAQFEVSESYITNVVNGFFTWDSWLATLRHLTVKTVTYGLRWADDGSGGGTGTTLTLDNVYVDGATTRAYSFYGLNYSSFTNVAADNFNAAGADRSGADAIYSFTQCQGIDIRGLGTEASKGQTLYAEGSRLSISGAKTLAMSGYTSAGTAASIQVRGAGAAVSIDGSSFAALSSPGNFLDLVVELGGVLTTRNTTLPTGGSTFLSYSGGARVIVARGGFAADRGQDAPTLTVGADEEVQRWATALTDNRVITLSTVGAFKGDRFRVIRSAGDSGGPWTLNVGGLKSLSANQWCEVTFSGSAWALTAYGAL